MNLADAIRQAALRQSEDQPMKETPEPQKAAEEAVAPPAPEPAPEPMPKFEVQEYAPALKKAKPSEPKSAPVSEPEPAEPLPSEVGKLTIQAPDESAARFFASDSSSGEPVPMPEIPSDLANGNLVRFEIFLSPEQLSCLFRALVATQHSMLTLREAAHYLRIPAHTLEQLATEGKIPALQLEGRWRFPKSGMDEWVMLQSFRDGEVSDAA
jgi:excisionase family DNA binding protein